LFALQIQIHEKQFGHDVERESIHGATATSTPENSWWLPPFFMWQNHQHKETISLERRPRKVW